MNIRTNLMLMIIVMTFLVVGNFLSIELWIQQAESRTHEINLAGRQRMLTQKLTKEVLFTLNGLDAKADAQETRQLFEVTLQGLQKGDANLHLTQPGNQEIAAQLAQIQTLWDQFKHTIDSALQGNHFASPEEQKVFYQESLDLLKEMNSVVALMEKDASHSIWLLRTIAIFFIFVSLIVVVISFYYIHRQVITRLQASSEHVAKLADRNLEPGELCTGRDEIYKLCSSIGKLINNWEFVIHKLFQVLFEVCNNSVQVWFSLTNNIHDMQRSEESMRETVKATDKMVSISRDVTIDIQTISSQAKESMENAKKGAQHINHATQSMDQLVEVTDDLERQMQELNNQTIKIGEIVKVIHGISDQTNLLALNAAIESARAGESGRGFSVVAGEVRALANRALKATGEISRAIHEIQGFSRSTATQMALAREKTNEAAASIQAGHSMIQAISEANQQTSNQIQTIAGKIEEQSQAVSLTSKNIESALQSSKCSRHNIELMLHDMGELSDVTQQLIDEVESFQTAYNPSVEIDKIMLYHRNWVLNFYRMYYGVIPVLDSHHAGDYHQCFLGTWMAGAGKEICQHAKEDLLVKNHEEFHSNCKKAAELLKSGNKAEALTYIEGANLSSLALMNNLFNIKNWIEKHNKLH